MWREEVICDAVWVRPARGVSGEVSSRLPEHFPALICEFREGPQRPHNPCKKIMRPLQSSYMFIFTVCSVQVPCLLQLAGAGSREMRRLHLSLIGGPAAVQ